MLAPEARVKKEFDDYVKSLPRVFNFKPVPVGYGDPGVDRFLCIQGRFVAVELKAPGKKPTPQQFACLRRVEEAGGLAFWADNIETVRQRLREFECR